MMMMTWMRLIDRLARGDDSLGAKVIFVEKNRCCGLKKPVRPSLFHENDPLWLTKDPAECPGMRRHGCHLLSGYDIPVKGLKWQKMCGSGAQTRPLSSYVAFRFYTYAFQKKKNCRCSIQQQKNAWILFFEALGCISS